MAFTPLGQPVPKMENKPVNSVVKPVRDFATGVAKGEISTLKGIGTIGQSILDQTAGRVVNWARGSGFEPSRKDGSISDVYRVGSKREVAAKQFLEPKSTAESVGKTIEQAAEFFIPASKIAKAETIITALTAGLPRFSGAMARIGGKALVTGVADATVAAAQTGDLKEGLKTGVMAGGVRAGMGVLGEAARSFRLPERIYQTVFKNASRDMMDEFKTDYLVDLYKSRPNVFKNLIEEGVIKVDGGVPVLNKTVAEEALDRGLKGSITSMGKQVAGGALESELKVRNIVGSYGGKVGLEQPEFFNVLREISEEYRNVGFGKISNEADVLAKKWLDGKGKVDGKTALDIRRLIDKARLARSFDVPITKLSLSQANLKVMADEARKRLNKIPGLDSAMADYSFYLDALEDLAKEGARRGNNQILSLIDSVFLGAGMAAGDFGQAITLAGLRKYLQSGRGATTIGSILKNPNIGPVTAGTIGAGSNLLAGESQDQTQQELQESRKSYFTPYTQQ